MMMMWLGFWLFNALGGQNSSWWGFPFFITFLVLTISELFLYVVVGAMIEFRMKKQS